MVIFPLKIVMFPLKMVMFHGCLLTFTRGYNLAIASDTAVKSMPDLVMVPVLSKTITEIFPATGILNIPRNLEATRYF